MRDYQSSVSIKSDQFHFSIERLENRAMLTASGFKVTNLVSDGSVAASFTDSKLKDPWGIAFNSNANVVWVSNDDTSTSTVYNIDGSVTNTGFYTSINIPAPSGSSGTGSPTGEIFNTSTSFPVTENGSTGSAAYVWATLNGTLAAWNPSVNATNAVTVADRSSTGAEFTGLAQDSVHGTQYLYTADVHNGTVDQFDGSFNAVHFKNAFKDPSIPAGFVPWNVQNVNGEIAVSYVKQNSAANFATLGKGTGIVDLFSAKGVLMEQLARGGNLNAPWAVVVAPKSFGTFAGDILVGNFGDGKVLAYNTKSPTAGRFVGFLTHATNSAPIQLPGLWGLTFGDSTDDDNTLFFTQGPAKTTGVFGTITIAKVKATNATSSGTSTAPVYP